MNANRLFGAILAAGLGVSLVGGASDAIAQKKKTATATPAAPAANPPDTKKPITLDPSNLAWGMSPKQVAELYDAVLDADYKPLYQATSPGVRMRALDAQLAEDKSQFRRSRVDFGKLPTGIDSTVYRPEYTYNNKEAMLSLTRKGEKRAFFFIQEKLWKVLIDRPLGDGATFFAKTYQDAAIKLSTTYGVPGRVLPADPSKNQSSMEVDWRDGSTHLRAIERSDTSFTLGYVDRATESSISSLRTAKIEEENPIDPAVAAAIRKGGDDSPGPPPSKDDKKKPKK